MTLQSDPTRTQVPFGSSFVHRLYFTNDVLGDDRGVLAEVLEPSEGRLARVQFWLDEHVARAQPDLRPAAPDFAAAHAEPDRARRQRAGRRRGARRSRTTSTSWSGCSRSSTPPTSTAGATSWSIGGGAVLDAVGFAAAIAHRGLRLVRLPTTTLAQADSGVGVKNGGEPVRQEELDRLRSPSPGRSSTTPRCWRRCPTATSSAASPRR